MNLKYMKVSLFEISYKKKYFHDILIYWDAPVYAYTMQNVYIGCIMCIDNCKYV